MGFLGNLFSSSNGAGFQGTAANIQQPVTNDQYNQSLQAQLGSLGQLQGLGSLLGSQTQGAVGAQNALQSLIAQRAAGGGPNPALDQLNQTTGQNIASQAALAAGQRGSNANVGLLARQIGQQGAGIQQNAIGQAATMTANQQIAAQNQLQGLTLQQVQQGLQGTEAGSQAAQSLTGQVLGGIGQQNAANVNMQSNLNNVNAGIAQGNQQFQQGVVGKVAGGAGALLGLPLGLAQGGSVPDSSQTDGPQSAFGKFMQGFNQAEINSGPQKSASLNAGEQTGQGISNVLQGLKSRLTGSSSLTPGAPIGDAGASDLMGSMPVATMAAKGGPIKGRTPLKSPNMIKGEQYASMGKKVPGKAMTKGDSLKNDTVPAMLSPGEIIVPRSHASDPEKAAAFARAVSLRNKGKR